MMTLDDVFISHAQERVKQNLQQFFVTCWVTGLMHGCYLFLSKRIYDLALKGAEL
jgi:hypothetical protein